MSERVEPDVTIERPDLERTTITDELESVTIHIIEGDRERTFDADSIKQADEAFDGDEFVATEIILESDPDLMRGLSGATLEYQGGEVASGSVPQATMDGDQTMLVVTARRLITADTDSSESESSSEVYSDLSVDDRVQYERWWPGRGRETFEGDIVEVDEDSPLSAFTRYRVENEDGWAWVPANEIEDVVGRKDADPIREAEFGDRLAGAVAMMDGEADELATRRPHRDGHLYDIEEGLRQHSHDLDGWLQEEYYR